MINMLLDGLSLPNVPDMPRGLSTACVVGCWVIIAVLVLDYLRLVAKSNGHGKGATHGE